MPAATTFGPLFANPYRVLFIRLKAPLRFEYSHPRRAATLSPKTTDTKGRSRFNSSSTIKRSALQMTPMAHSKAFHKYFISNGVGGFISCLLVHELLADSKFPDEADPAASGASLAVADTGELKSAADLETPANLANKLSNGPPAKKANRAGS